MTQDADNDRSGAQKKIVLGTSAPSDSNAHIIIEEKQIDNPGMGNCAFYAFAIGLIEIIQEENIGRGDRRSIFKRWAVLDPTINTDTLYEDICNFDDKKPNNRLLDQLQKSLRQITYECTLIELRQACARARDANNYKMLVATSSFMNFSFLYHGNIEWIDPRYNEYASLHDVKKMLDALEHGHLERKPLAEDDKLKLVPPNSKVLGVAALKLKTLFNKLLKADVAKLRELKSEALSLQDALTKALRAIESKAEILTEDLLETAKLTELKAESVRQEELINDSLRDEALKIIRKNPAIVVEEHEQLTLAPVFMSFLYGKDVDLNSITAATEPQANSPIIKAAKIVTQNYFWGTHSHLNHLANVFAVNLHTLTNGNADYVFADDPERHVITVNNKHNAHWTTMVTLAKSLSVSVGGNEKTTKTPPQVTSVAKKQADDVLMTTSKTEAAKQVEPAKKTEAAKQVEPAKKTEAAKQVEPAKKTEAAKQVEPAKKTEAAKKVEPVKNIELAKVKSSAEIVKQEQANSVENRMLARLKHQIANSTKEYCNYSNSVWFSFFHRHGETGRKRAKSFEDKLAACIDYNDAKKMVVDFLKDKKNGNTHPHSFRTMLLQELLIKDKRAPDLKYLSKNFSEQLDIVQIQLNIERKSFPLL